MKRLVVLSGAGISAESGISTFRDSGGLWEGYDVMEVATPQGWVKNPTVVLEFYNQRRKNVREAKPNAAHKLFAELENLYEVDVVTQNVDDLHERGGSTKVLHLHGEILKAQSSLHLELIYNLGDMDINLGDTCELGSQLRPFIVWFGEAVPKLEEAAQMVGNADILVIIGTSLQVYPAAGLMHYCKSTCKTILIDPKAQELSLPHSIKTIAKTAVNALDDLKKYLSKSI